MCILTKKITFLSSEPVNLQDGFLAGELPIHQGGVRHEASQDGRVDGECGESNLPHNGRQSLHLC